MGTWQYYFVYLKKGRRDKEKEEKKSPIINDACPIWGKLE